MQQSVGELLQLVGGAANRSERTGRVAPQTEKKPFLKISAAHNGNEHGNGAGNGHAAKTLSLACELAVSPVASRRGEIPLGGDFKDF